MIDLLGKLTIVFGVFSVILILADVTPSDREWRAWSTVTLAIIAFWGCYLAYNVFVFMWYG